MANLFDPFREMDRFFADVQRHASPGVLGLDLYREGEKFVAVLDLPGVDSESIDIDVNDSVLTVRAERPGVTGDVKWLSHERASGTFARQLQLGRGLATDRIQADYVNGVLTLTIPVAEEAKPRKIEVSTGANAVEEAAAN